MAPFRFSPPAAARADRCVKDRFPHLHQREILDIFRRKKVRQQNRPLKKGDIAEAGEALVLDITEAQAAGQIEAASDARLDIRYEDENLLIVNKPVGMHTVAQMYSETDTLINQVMAVKGPPEHSLADLNFGSINRLDRETSGLVIFARKTIAWDRLMQMMRQGEIRKFYAARVQGSPPDFLEMEDVYKDRTIVQQSEVYTAKRGKRDSLVLLELFTGARHQLRRQLAGRGYPVVGDGEYGSGGGEMYLHALYLEFRHPLEDKSVCALAPLPESWSFG